MRHVSILSNTVLLRSRSARATKDHFAISINSVRSSLCACTTKLPRDQRGSEVVRGKGLEPLALPTSRGCSTN